jgi:periplasmic protein TonB
VLGCRRSAKGERRGANQLGRPAIEYEGSSASTRESFAATLGLAERCPPASGWVCGPLGFGLHFLAIGTLVASALFSPLELVPPPVAALRLNLAPPPPSPIRSSAVASTSFLETKPVSTSDFVAPRRIPDEVLSPRFELTAGLEVGFLDGSDQGLPGGIPGGVVGGTPGGIVGGVVGGTGDELPRFQKPDVGPSPVRMPQPTYTEQAIRNNVTGTVVLRVVIDERGGVRVLKVIRSVPELDDEAIRVVESSWLFHPATKSGRPIAALSDLVVRFSLH